VQRVTLEEVPLAGLAWRSQGYGASRSVHDFQNLPGALTFYSGTTLEQVSTG
jgi:peptide/nickel transport system substrate-binding protein